MGKYINIYIYVLLVCLWVKKVNYFNIRNLFFSGMKSYKKNSIYIYCIIEMIRCI